MCFRGDKLRNMYVGRKKNNFILLDIFLFLNKIMQISTELYMKWRSYTVYVQHKLNWL